MSKAKRIVVGISLAIGELVATALLISGMLSQPARLEHMIASGVIQLVIAIYWIASLFEPKSETKIDQANSTP